MGYYKNMEVELQEALGGRMPFIHDPELRRIVAWDVAHRHAMTAEERYRVITTPILLQRALALFDSEDVPAPKRAVDHVALQTRRSRKHVTERQSFRRTIWFLLGLTVIPVAFFVLVAVEVY
jgi:hypothetical protein